MVMFIGVHRGRASGKRTDALLSATRVFYSTTTRPLVVCHPSPKGFIL